MIRTSGSGENAAANSRASVVRISRVSALGPSGIARRIRSWELVAGRVDRWTATAPTAKASTKRTTATALRRGEARSAMRDSWTQITTPRPRGGRPRFFEGGDLLGVRPEKGPKNCRWVFRSSRTRHAVASGPVSSRLPRVAVSDAHSFDGADPIEVGDLLYDGFRHGGVHREHHDRRSPCRDPPDLHSCDVDRVLAQQGAYATNHPRAVDVPHEQHVGSWDQVDAIRIQMRDPRLASAEQRPAQHETPRRCLQARRNQAAEILAMVSVSRAQLDAPFLCQHHGVDNVDRLIEDHFQQTDQETGR